MHQIKFYANVGRGFGGACAARAIADFDAGRTAEEICRDITARTDGAGERLKKEEGASSADLDVFAHAAGAAMRQAFAAADPLHSEFVAAFDRQFGVKARPPLNRRQRRALSRAATP
jgi:hypothetical protein